MGSTVIPIADGESEKSLKQSLKLLRDRVATPEKDLPPWDWKLGAGLILAYVAAIFAALLMVTSLADADFAAPNPGYVAWANLIACVVALLLIVQYTSGALVHARHEKRAPTTMNLQQALRLIPSKNTPLYAVLMIAFIVAVATDTIGLVLGLEFNTLPAPIAGLTLDEPLPFLIGVGVILLLRPVVEELIFRGVFYPGLLKSFTQWQAIGISSLIFAGLHYALDPTYVWWGFVQPLALGLTAGTARAATQSTQAAIGTHMMFALFVVLRAVVEA